ncbi:MAG: site-2 protease family protein [Planctomycetaceae bacterium]
MELMDLFLFADAIGVTSNIVIVALGLGLVIFFHELGHFAVAKWCNVHVERFSIGFGPILWSKKRGETEYAISAIPFGGYVKMLGQDDMDPSQLSSEEIAEDPRSYSAKSVPQRMAIISAGVIMNVVTGMLFFAIAFGIGVQAAPPRLGSIHVGKRAWQAGLQTGDYIEYINDRKIESFMDITRGVALTSGTITFEGKRRDGSELPKTEVIPDGRGTRRVIGVGAPLSTTIINPPPGQNIPITAPGTAAAKADPPLKPGDEIKKIDKTPIPNFATMQWILAERRNRPVDLYVKRAEGSDEDLVKIHIEANPFRTLGLSMDIGKIAAIRRGSPAERAGLQAGDKIVFVNGIPIGSQLNPLKLPDEFETFCQNRATVELKVVRKDGGKDPETVRVQFTDSDLVMPGWIEQPSAPGTPLSIPSLGVAFHMIPTIVAVKKDSPAEKAKILPEERVKKMILTLPEESEPDGLNKNKPVEIEFGKKDEKTGQELNNWAYAFWMMQMARTRDVSLVIANAKGEERTVELTPAVETDWFLPTRGFRPDLEFIELQADDVLHALQLGTKRARDSIFDIYLTLTSLFGGRLSYKELSGPVGIAKVAYRVAEQGIPELLLFLGFLSVNLAVLNFLPIPVLDGGHMVFLCWEAITRKKPSERVMVAATYIGMAFILGLMGLVLYLDLFVH